MIITRIYILNLKIIKVLLLTRTIFAQPGCSPGAPDATSSTKPCEKKAWFSPAGECEDRLQNYDNIDHILCENHMY